MGKLPTRWVPPLITVDHTHNREGTSNDSVGLFIFDQIMRRFIFVVEIWIYHKNRRPSRSRDEEFHWANRKVNICYHPKREPPHSSFIF